MRIWLFKYDRDGYDKEGFDREGRDRWGRDRDGFNRDGFDRRGLHRNGTRYDDEGYDQEGFGRDGLDREGFDKERNELPTRKQGGLIVLKARVKRLERLAEISNGLLDKLGIESAQQEPSSNADVRLKLPRDDASDTAIAHFQKISEFYSTHAGLCPRCGNQLTDPPLRLECRRTNPPMRRLRRTGGRLWKAGSEGQGKLLALEKLGGE